MCAQRMFRLACAFEQCAQNLLLTRMQSYFMRITKILIRLRGCAGWFESSLGAHVRKYDFSRSVVSVRTCLLMYVFNPQFILLETSKWRYPGNTTITKHSPTEVPKIRRYKEQIKTKTNSTYKTKDAQRTETELPSRSDGTLPGCLNQFYSREILSFTLKTPSKICSRRHLIIFF